ncbi:MAG: TfoX/Sxy family protein [Anaerolineales bacterium]|nr:TfoX/Sxy family protein [Anaerolineales bacterium]
MASDIEFVDYVTEQCAEAGHITYRKMFGEYAIYCNGIVVALVCDNRVFVKPTAEGNRYIGEVVEAPPYPGAKNSFLIEEHLDDREWFSGLIGITEKELLKNPKPRKRSKSIKAGEK